jgi:hypothetical protein
MRAIYPNPGQLRPLALALCPQCRQGDCNPGSSVEFWAWPAVDVES